MFINETKLTQLYQYEFIYIVQKMDAGREIVRYEAPKPVIGIHRYVFLLFKQRARHSVRAPPSRDRFNTRGFCEEQGLGTPVAAVYFNAQRETAARRR